MYNPQLIDALAADRRREATWSAGSQPTDRNGPAIRVRRGIGRALILVGNWVMHGAGI